MNTADMFPSKWLKAKDLKGRAVKLTIEQIVQEEIGGENKFVVYFAGRQKGLVLNKTNSDAIEEQHGTDTDDWLGKEITIASQKVSFKGDRVDAIRVQPGLTAPVVAADDEDIPF